LLLAPSGTLGLPLLSIIVVFVPHQWRDNAKEDLLLFIALSLALATVHFYGRDG
jgi:hypothetical protein